MEVAEDCLLGFLLLTVSTAGEDPLFTEAFDDVDDDTGDDAEVDAGVEDAAAAAAADCDKEVEEVEVGEAAFLEEGFVCVDVSEGVSVTAAAVFTREGTASSV